MHDIRTIRENPDAFVSEMARRGLATNAGQLVAIDEKRRELIQLIDTSRSQRKEMSRRIGSLRKSELPADIAEVDRLGAKVKQQKSELEQAELELTELETILRNSLAELPNVLAPSVPKGLNEDDNRVESVWGEIPEFGFTPRSHDEIGELLDGSMNFTAAAKTSGARFVFLTGQLSRLERVLADLMLEEHTTQHGYLEVSPPILVNSDSMFGTGQLPKFAEDLFRTDDGRYLIPTAEVPLTNLVREQIVSPEQLPMRLTALTPCFRAEAGSAGQDTRGMLRQHQFNKVEMVSIVRPEDSNAELERMRGCAEKILQLLELPYRVVTLCSGDTGFSAQHTYDLEVWLPAQQRYREISSCSNCGAFQARRMNARYRTAGGKPDFLHTLNGSGVAVGRALIAVLENGQQADGSVRLPAAVGERMGTSIIARHS